jgi:hypothetical protein
LPGVQLDRLRARRFFARWALFCRAFDNPSALVRLRLLALCLPERECRISVRSSLLARRRLLLLVRRPRVLEPFGDVDDFFRTMVTSIRESAHKDRRCKARAGSLSCAHDAAAINDA